MFGNGGIPLLDPYEVAALRIFSAGIVLLPFLKNAIKRIPKKYWGYIILSGFTGNFLPAFLFCIAETRIDSALTAMLNTVTPIAALLLGILVYGSPVRLNQWIGVIIGFAGCVMLFSGSNQLFGGQLSYALLVVVATICYGFNVNMVRNKLAGVSSLDISAGAFAVYLLPSAIILFVSGFQNHSFTKMPYVIAVSATSVLGIVGTALASVSFYKLVKNAGPVFASMVTYCIPFVAILWGALYGETITARQVIGLLIILIGVYLAGRQGRPFTSRIRGEKKETESISE